MIDKKIKKIGILTSGGDAPGMNAAIRAVVRVALAEGIEVKGIVRGYNGLIRNDMIDLSFTDVSGVIQRGGTILFTARSDEFETVEGQIKAIESCKKEGIDGLVVLGGDGTFRGARDIYALSKEYIDDTWNGLSCICVPCTIDNDIASTNYTIGFDTAMNTAIEMVDKLRDTAQSHDRCTIVEVMGRKSGHLALNVGISCGATAILVPEIPYDFKEDVIDKIIEHSKVGKRHFILVVAEGLDYNNNLAEKIENITEIETRLSVLGHVQRGGSPTARDRMMASIMGERAVVLLLEGKNNRVVAIQNDIVRDYSFNEAFSMQKSLNMDLYQVAHKIAESRRFSE